MAGVGIASFAKKLVYDLSGGEQQKVALARAIAQEPLILLLDEFLQAMHPHILQVFQGRLRRLGAFH
jgi:ABC-type proline/glycine betaine transport system ATPase subunit